MDMRVFQIESGRVLPMKGDILISSPFFRGHDLTRSVVLLLEHNEEGKPAEAPTMHVAQTDKRFRKLETVADNYEPFLNNAKYDEADVLVVGMASSRGAIEEAVAEFDQ